MSHPTSPIRPSRLPSLGPHGEGWVAIQLAFLVVVAASGLVGGSDWGGPAAALTAFLGLALMIAGAALLARGLIDLGDNLTPLPYPRDGARLVRSGVYALVRHPLYAGLALTAFGWGLVSASALTLALAALLAAFFDLKARREEAWLRERHADYAAYASTTRRFVPGLY